MKIIEIIPHLGSGGAERFCVDLSNELARMGHVVILCTLYPMDGELGFYKDDINKNVRTISMNKGRGFSLKAIWRFLNVVRKEKPDIIHSHIGALQYALLPQLFCMKGFHTVHNEAHKETSSRLEFFIRRLFLRIGIITPITISKESHESFISFYHRKALLIPNGRSIENVRVSQIVLDEINSYRQSLKDKVIVQVARFQPQKNIPMMARVAKQLSDEGYRFVLLFIGNTCEKTILDEVRKEMPSCAHILGERKNPLEYLKASGCFSLSSKYEGMPISLIEALGVGAIPVCTPVGGIPNAVINGENGILSDDTSEEAFYKALKRYLEMGEIDLEEMRKKVFLSYEPYSIKKCAQRYLEAFSARSNTKSKTTCG